MDLCFAGIDLGGTKILGRILDPDDPTRALAETRRDTPRGDEAIIESLAGVVDDLRQASGGDRLAAVGIGAAGLIDGRGVLRMAPNLPGVAEFDLGRRLAERLGLPVSVDNDATCATWAEHVAGAARGSTDSVLVTLGTGIGGGVVAGGRLQRGAHGFAGEAGHMMVDPNGPPCPCGRRGCWERYASGTGLGRLARDAAQAGNADRVVALAGGDPEAVRGEHVTEAARLGDPEALEVLQSFAWWVAVGLANLVNVLDPDVVVVGGGLVAAGEFLLGPTRRAFHDLVLAAEHRPPARILPADLGTEAGAIGAGLLAVDALAG